MSVRGLLRAVADLLALAGAGAIIGFFVAQWWLPQFSPVPWMGNWGAIGATGAAALGGALLGLRVARPQRAVLFAMVAVGVAQAVFVVVVTAPARLGAAPAGALVGAAAAQRVIISLFLCAPIALLASVVGAAVSSRKARDEANGPKRLPPVNATAPLGGRAGEPWAERAPRS